MTMNEIEAMNTRSLRKQRKLLTEIIALKNKVTDSIDKNALDHLAKQMADELSVPYQIDAVDEG